MATSMAKVGEERGKGKQLFLSMETGQEEEKREYSVRHREENVKKRGNTWA
ncbi:predicted protein [Sclerotinia sclerotiorum 1980 UF-70]|uniref:Uncharacterized protein n=1 Tax=Sclerotinia sclerotiorum (strain ATCC 18683 / 1980 / Ss-1) TaxID=665079 RepID=A7EYU2_SCLS1|nr:predicted protein [Sclerotinia sclerotiorum 1980 UF-70]EDN94634.1 predicted protein [Sclerotinia sclerotiorum 1980 UF-70]